MVFFYLIDCLYTERKDRSILFWKSLPVSDARSCCRNCAVAMVVVPLGVILLTAITQFLFYIIVWLRLHGSRDVRDALPDWSFLAWLRAQAVALGVMLGGVLWYAPIAGYLLLLSAWAQEQGVPVGGAAADRAADPRAACSSAPTMSPGFLGERFAGYIQLMKVDTDAFEAGNRENMPSVSDVLRRIPPVECVHQHRNVAGRGRRRGHGVRRHPHPPVSRRILIECS